MRLKEYLNSKFEVFSLMKPGASVGNTMDPSITDLTKVIKNDVIMFTGGSDDVNKVNMNVILSQITKFIQG